MSHAPTTLYFLQTSRAIRIAWALGELNLAYDVEKFDRTASGETPSHYRSQIAVGRAPAIKHGDMILVESGAITEYLCEKFDDKHVLMPRDPAARAAVRTWMSASEGTFLVHALAIAYGSGAAPHVAEDLQAQLSGSVHRDFDWMEQELQQKHGKFLVGDTVTAADTMMGFSVDFILKMKLGTSGKRWPAVEKWLESVHAAPAYQRAVEKTGFVL